MLKKGLCIVYNFAQLYREPIFKLIDTTWDCDWYFGTNSTDVKEMPREALKRVHTVATKQVFGPIEWQNGIGRLMRDSRYDTYLMLGEPMVLSTWWCLIQRRLFKRNKRVYLWSHGWYGREGIFKKWLKRAFFGMADHVFTYGEYAREQAIRQGFDGSKITPIHNSLDHATQVKLRMALKPSDVYRKHFGNDATTLIFIGRLTAVKRLDMLLYAMKLLEQNGEIFNLILIGDGAKRLDLEGKASVLGFSNRVWFYGRCYDDTQNAQLIYDADLCVAPGNVGLTAMHTMVFGTPVLTHDDFPWQMPEFEAIRPGKTGDFFKRDDVTDLAAKISRWTKRKTDRDAVRQACYEEIDSHWTPEYQLEKITTIFTKSSLK